MTNDDVKQFQKLIREELAPIKETLGEHGKMLNEHGKMLNEHGKMLNEHGKILKQHSNSLKDLKKNQDTILNMLDREQMDQKKRLKKVEQHLGLSSAS